MAFKELYEFIDEEEERRQGRANDKAHNNHVALIDELLAKEASSTAVATETDLTKNIDSAENEM